MFHSVGHSRHSVLVAEVPDMDVEGSTGLVGVGVMDEQGLEPVLQADYAVVAII